MFNDMRIAKKLAPVGKKYVLTMPDTGAQFFSEFKTIEAYMANQEANKALSREMRRQRIWDGMKPAEQRKPLVDRKKITFDGRGEFQHGVLRPQPMAAKTMDNFGAMIAAEMQKAGIL